MNGEKIEGQYDPDSHIGSKQIIHGIHNECSILFCLTLKRLDFIPHSFEEKAAT
jgi:hypothetical protein